MNILVVDVGGTSVKILATGQEKPRKFRSGPTLTAEQMVATVRELAGDWPYDVVSIGYPGFVVRGRPITEPHNLALGCGLSPAPETAVFPSPSATTVCDPLWS
jgi:polyphosphate glucokinase